MPYKAKDALKPQNLKGISSDQIEQHWELYRGYVKNVNELIAEIAGAEPGSRPWAELKRRAGFELNGVVLHELVHWALAHAPDLPHHGSTFARVLVDAVMLEVAPLCLALLAHGCHGRRADPWAPIATR